MKKLQELWAKYKVQISFVGGALVVMTTHGSCTFEPAAPAAEVSANEVADVAVAIDETIEEINADNANDAADAVELEDATAAE